MGDAGADTMTSCFLKKKLKIPSAVYLHLMKKQMKINECQTDLESEGMKPNFLFFWWFYFSQVISTQGNRSASSFASRDDLTCRTTRPRAARRVWMDAIILSNLPDWSNTARGPDEDWGWSQSTSHELWGRFCTWMTCWETFSPKPRRHLTDFGWKSLVNTRLREVTFQATGWAAMEMK